MNGDDHEIEGSGDLDDHSENIEMPPRVSYNAGIDLNQIKIDYDGI